MGKFAFGVIGFVIVVGGLLLIGMTIGGGWATGMANEEQLQVVHACIDNAGGSITKADLAACLAGVSE